VTGYLQRLVASAVNPAPAIKPVLGPVFMAPRFEAEPVPGAVWANSVREHVAAKWEPASSPPARDIEPAPPEAPLIPEDSPAPRAFRQRTKASPDRSVFQSLIEGPQAEVAADPQGDAGSVAAARRSAAITNARPDSPALHRAEREAPGDAARASAKPNESLERLAYETPMRVPEAASASDRPPQNRPPEKHPPGIETSRPARAKRNESPERLALETPMRVSEAASASYRPPVSPNTAPDLETSRPARAKQDELPERFAFEPLMRPPDAVASYLLPDNRPPDFAAPYRNISQERISRRESSVRSQPDEVQIHIGRIEVTAPPPPAAPAIRKPDRKTLSLSEYLNRGR
jgi:hypothetical protein